MLTRSIQKNKMHSFNLNCILWRELTKINYKSIYVPFRFSRILPWWSEISSDRYRRKVSVSVVGKRRVRTGKYLLFDADPVWFLREIEPGLEIEKSIKS